MTLWKTALAGAALGLAACQPVGVPMGEERLAGKIADVVITKDDLQGIAMQQVQGLMYQGSISQDQVDQIGLAMRRELQDQLPEIKKTLVEGLTREFNIKELEFFHDQLTSKYAKSVQEKQQAAMSGAGEQLQGLAQEAATRAVARVNSGWPTGAPPAPPPQPDGQPQLPPGMVLPN
jgi:hypothetical protein